MAYRRLTRKPQTPRLSIDESRRGDEIDFREQVQALPRTSRFRAHDDDDDDTDGNGRAVALRLTRSE